jgi:hypothetical protein
VGSDGGLATNTRTENRTYIIESLLADLVSRQLHNAKRICQLIKHCLVISGMAVWGPPELRRAIYIFVRWGHGIFQQWLLQISAMDTLHCTLKLLSS